MVEVIKLVILADIDTTTLRVLVRSLYAAGALGYM